MAGGKKKTKSKGEKERAPRGVRSPVKAAARPENVEGEQELDDKELDDVSGGGDVAGRGDAKETRSPSEAIQGFQLVRDTEDGSRPVRK